MGISAAGTWLKQARAAKALGAAPWPWQLAEALLLRFPPCRLGLSEYFDYRLFEPHRSWSEKRLFVGWRGESALDAGNAPSTHLYADDKLALAQLLLDAGLPHPELLARYDHPQPRAFGRNLQGRAELMHWLRHEAVYPLFAKPVHAGFGNGAFLLQDIERSRDELLLGTGGCVGVEKWVGALANPEGLGYLFQRSLSPHASLSELLSGRLSSVRLMSLQLPGQAPYIYRVVWKIPRKFNIIDNFESGTTGNLLAAVDTQTGRVQRVIQGYGLDLRELDRHPDSGISVRDLVLPDWERLKEVSLAASRLLPEFRFQHWDVAFSADGPMLLELNLFAAGGTELSQLVDGRGLMEPVLMEACRA